MNFDFDGLLTEGSPSGVNETCFSVEGDISGEVGALSMGGLDDEGMSLDSSGSGFKVLEVEEVGEDLWKHPNTSTEMSGNGSFSGQDGSILGSRSSGLKGKVVLLDGLERSGDEGPEGILNLRLGKKILKRGMDFTNRDDKILEDSECGDGMDDGLGDYMAVDENGSAKRSTKIRKEFRGNEEYGKDSISFSTCTDAIKLDYGFETQNITDHTVRTDGFKLVDAGQTDSGGDKSGIRILDGVGNSGNGIVTANVDERLSWDDNGNIGERRFTGEEKGKGVLVNDHLLANVFHETDLGLESERMNLSDDITSAVSHLVNNPASQYQERWNYINKRHREFKRNENMERFREIAKENASRFAHFTPDEEDNRASLEAEVENKIEDCSGPFSTTMKLIRDRDKKSRRGCTSSESLPTSIVTWVPRRDQGKTGARVSVPSLQELSLYLLAKNADAVVSLDNVPDALRHKLSQLICDSRKMNVHFFELLVSGSPTEIRVRDCSWMTEEQFTKSFQLCDTANLVVLQLDLCGRCMTDYVILATLAQSPKQLPRLTSLSISGACRLTDRGLSILVSSAPALRSINLSQCSLLTPASLYVLADSLGSLLKELYLDDCLSIDAALIVPALQKLEHLEVLSVAGIQTVCDDFVKNFVVARGHNLKELVLKNCGKLTDSSVKFIAEFCPGLCSLDLKNLCKLTDSSIGYLTNGCRALHTLKLCRSPFSDEAIAAFLETTGGCLAELSLNNVKKVGHHTALSLASRAKKLHSLDLSWCRNLTDNEVGLIVDSCFSLRLLKLFGCTQITEVFVHGHSNREIQIIGCMMSPLLQHIEVPDPGQGALRYSAVPSYDMN
ncbi:DNA repair protein rhp7-like isoform X2 [Senna tora]|uniref:DNA repair protein rhp7-like isoform X2 n=1 Tax=Senna tora TaxID=362788 RepID=A0A834X3M0_9FABA|nr:DNA repair protein rhp7-like isoform X2 [Senna tora]